MTDIPAQNKRGYFVLPQRFEGGGYYTYGTPSAGRGQYAHPKMISVLQAVAAHWCQLDHRKFGIGNISLANGTRFKPHDSHRSGLEVDIRPIRTDGKDLPCNILDNHYDRAATTKLVALFTKHAMVRLVLFNDTAIPHVRRAAGHNNHFHVELIG